MDVMEYRKCTIFARNQPLLCSLQPGILPGDLFQLTPIPDPILPCIKKDLFKYFHELWKQYKTHEYHRPIANPAGPRIIPPITVVVAAMQPPFNDSLIVTRTCLSSVSWATTLISSLEFIGILEL
jgi:hypothetical protein